jgi:hypothetical protein
VVSDDADALKKVCDETGRSQQVCKSLVGRNTDALVAELSAMISTGQDHSTIVSAPLDGGSNFGTIT